MVSIWYASFVLFLFWVLGIEIVLLGVIEWNYGFNGNLLKGVLVLQSFHSENLKKLNAIDVKHWGYG
jgi:hypothetical protein